VNKQYWIVIALVVVIGIVLALTLDSAVGKNAPQALGEEIHAGTFEEPRLISEPAWQGAVFLDTDVQPNAFYIAAFGSEPEVPNPAFPQVPQSSESWTYAGQHSGLGPDLKPFNEPTRIDALHLAQINDKKALLRSRINGVPSAATPYPTTPESNDHWAFIGVFEKSGTETEMKDYGDLVWPGVFMRHEPDQSVYIALRTGSPVVDAWPEPDSKEGADYWKYVGTDSAIDPKLPKPWSERSVRIGSFYQQPATLLSNYYWGSKFVGFPVLIGAEFPHPAQPTSYWTYLGRHLGSSLDPKAFGEPYSDHNFYRARIKGKWVDATPFQYQGAPSAETPFPTELESNAFWRLVIITAHAGTWQNPKTQEDTYTWAGQIHSNPQGNGQALFRSLESHYSDVTGWYYQNTEKWQPLGTSLHAGTVADPKGQDELTWPGAVHATTIDEQMTYFRSLEEGVPAEHDWPLPTTATSNEHWQLITEVPALGTFEEPRRFDDYSQAGSVYVDTFANGQHNFYISHIEGYPADDIDSFATIGRQGDPNWEFVGRHSGLMTDLKPFDDITRVGAFHEAEISGQRALLRSRIDGWPSTATPYPASLASTEHWEFIGVFKHDGTAGDFKGNDEVTWPGALHLDEAQQLVFAAKQAGEPGPEGWLYPVGEDSNDQWDFVMSLAANSGTVEGPRERNMPSIPGVIFADQRGLLSQKLYRSKFSGYAKDVGAVYPSAGESNEFYEYLGDHAGTFTDPKPFTEPTWTGAVHQTIIDGQLVFLKARFEGAPSAATPYPQTLASNDFWDFEFATEQAGTYVDPKSMSGNTWPGAIHQYDYQGNVRLHAAQKFGNPEAEGWPSPNLPSGEYWKLIGNVRHKGTFADPKEFDEVTGVGLIHTTTIDGELVYFRSLVNGDPAENGWAYPEASTSNQYWQYLGRNLRQGTWDDPKGANDFTWPGQTHAVQIGDKRVYLIAKMDGLPAEDDWPYPESVDNAYWSIAGESRHSGSFHNPKDQQEVTWVGAIHMRQDGERRMYYRSKVAGNLVTVGDSYPLPEGESNNAGWDYIGANSAAGMLTDPHIGSVLTWPGNVHKTAEEEWGTYYYLALFTGIADSHHPFPAFGGNSNQSWKYVGRSQFPGTVLQPKIASDITWPGAIHRFERDGETHYVRSKFNGVPPESGWEYPAQGNDEWEYPDMGILAGTWNEPKNLTDATWPEAIHVLKSYVWVNGWVLRRSFYRSKFWGKGTQQGAGYLNPDYFDPLGYSVYQGTLDSPKYFDQPTWAGAIHLDRNTHFFFEARQSGEMGVDVGAHPETATSNHYWLYLGEHRHAGVWDDPKQWTEYTWPGRIHNYDIGRTILYFSARMTGTPSEQNPPWSYPTDESSNDWWAYEGRTDHAGTFAEPHEWNEVTWKGAIHQVKLPDRIRYFEAKFAGNGQQLGYDYPTGDISDRNWEYVATGLHAGTVEDPKDYGREPVWPGAIVVNTRALVGRYYYVAQNDGIPLDNNWPLPTGDTSNENWGFYGASNHAGTKDDPKTSDEVTWPGAFNRYDNGYLGVRAFFSPTQALIPDEHEGWQYPGSLESNDKWIYSDFIHANGTFDNPKSFNHLTDIGLIHSTTLYSQVRFFAAKFQGQAVPSKQSSSVPVKSFPDGPYDNEWWRYMRRGDGTVNVPNSWDDYSMVGDVNAYFVGGKRLLFKAKKEGRPSDHNWYYPGDERDNDYWQYFGTHRGTYDDPKDWPEFTSVGDIHRYPHADNTLFFKAKKEGYPASLGFYPTAPNQDTDAWAYAGLHSGTRQDPKVLGEPTWAGAIHWDRQRDRHFESRAAGLASNYPPGDDDNGIWEFIDTANFAAPGINDFSKPFDEYTWVTAHNAYLDSLTGHLQRGVRGLMLDVHYDHAMDNPKVRMCHVGNERCSNTTPLLSSGLAEVLAYLKRDRNAVISLLFESTITHGSMQSVLNEVPDLARYVYNQEDRRGTDNNTWATLQEMIDTNKRLVMFSSGEVPGRYDVAGIKVDIMWANDMQVENTYNIGTSVLTHNWKCESRYDDLPLSLRKVRGAFNRPFVLNQFHEWGGIEADAGNIDNNLTYLQRRVEYYCGSPSGWRKPNYLGIDFIQVGDAFPYAAALSQGGFYFYEGNDADRARDTVCVLPASQSPPGGVVSYDLGLKSHGCENDEIRSMELDGISAGTRIELYDSPDADRQDDFTIIDVKQSVPLGQRVRLNSLGGGSEENFWYRKRSIRDNYNGLDGKISRVRVLTTPANGDFSDASVTFYQEVNAQQDIICTVDFTRQDVRAKRNGYGCDNDQIDSAVIGKAKAGSYFAVAGHPDGEYKEGLAEVRVKKDILMPVVVRDFEHQLENEFFEIRRCRGHRLEGKISFMEFYPGGREFVCPR
jgi:hypothetical protein